MPFNIDTAYTLAEVLKSYDPEKKLHHLIDVFKDQRPILEEGYWVTANNDNSHEMLRVTKRPEGKFTRVNEGYEREGVASIPVTEQLAMIGSLFELDKRLADKQPNPGAWRAQRSKIHVAGMISTFNDKFWNGNSKVDVKEVDGLLTRYTPASVATAPSNTINCSSWKDSATDLYPVIVVGWGEDGTQLINPKDGKKTFWEDDRGLVDLLDDNKRPYPGYRSYFNFQYGIGVGDERMVQRLYNCAVSKIPGSSGFENSLLTALNNMPVNSNVAIYVGKQVMTAIMQRLNDKGNMHFTRETVWKREMPTIWGVPIIRDDSLNDSESVIS